MDVCEWGPIFDETQPVCNHFTANDQNRGLFHTTVKFGFQYGCVRMRSNIRRNAPCMQSFHGKWPKPSTISHNSEIWISIWMCANDVQYSTKRTLVCNHFTANDQNRRLFHTTVKFGFQYGCVRMRSNIRRNAPCMQSFHGKWPKPSTISHNSEIWISVWMCANETQYSTKRTLYAIISRQMTKTVDYFTQQWNLDFNMDGCEWDPIFDETYPCMQSFHGKWPKPSTISHNSEIWISIWMCANEVQYSTKRTLYAIISRQMTKTVDYFTQQWNLDFNMDVCEWGPIFDETHPVCNHFTANDQNRRLFHTTVKFGFQYRCVRMRPNIRRNVPSMQSFHGKWPKPSTISHNSEI